MSRARVHLAQLNIGRLVAPLDDPRIAGFVDDLERINALADGHAGFVWRLQNDTGDATSYRLFDESTLVNMSVWETIDDLYAYTYGSAHLEPLRRRREWFLPFEGPHLVLWWVPAGHRPDLVEAGERLERLRRDGPTAEAFTFRQRFEPPPI
jgi:hypothetical protein